MSQEIAAPFAIGGIYLVVWLTFELIQRVERRRYLRLWANAFLLFVAHAGTDCAILTFSLPDALHAVAWVAMVVACACVVMGSYEVLRLRLPRFWLWLSFGAVGTAAAGAAVGLQDPWPRVPVFLFIGFALLQTGANFFRGGPPGAGHVIAGVGCSLAGAYSALYPFVRPWVVSVEFVLDMMFITTSALGVLLMHFELARFEACELAERYRSLFDGAREGLFRVEPRGGRLLAVNPAMLRILRCTEAEALKLELVRDLLVEPSDRETYARRLRQWERVEGTDLRWRRRDGGEARVHFSARLVRGSDGAPRYFEGSAHDVSVELRLREQLARTERLESLGRLVSGISHDFNNMLTVIIANIELATRRFANGGCPERPLLNALEAARGAAKFTGQLLEFGRRHVPEARAVDVSAAVGAACDIVEATLGDHIQVETRIEAQPLIVMAGSGQIERMVVNLAVNARDAMPSGGRLVVRARRAELRDGSPGAVVTVADTGTGMDDATRQRIFEPFFTTKEEGTGLGLAAVYGIVRQLKGWIEVDSHPGVGTTFTIKMPLVEEKAPVSVSTAPASPMGLVILVVEDRPPLLDSTAQGLREFGYEVMTASSAEEAIELARGRRVDLLLTDVVMPAMNGTELATVLREQQPELKVLFMSGYAKEHVMTRGSAAGHFVAKPFTLEQLAAAVGEAVAEPA